ncbi:hypothetical protein CLI64_11360 [Nostoc sp. CENA543]|uniref:tetratricopeptide repeat protein n=1 Tax=Nostoc sp. CENA543 TaxID=1869241 RepID=UPI000CA256E2|nr:tetratricopeptide repeat protein [Nostoc sp. CENA543]AUT00951.1 hypothetical protein CLI64_11360 [Nostoc sp. CENA543]
MIKYYITIFSIASVITGILFLTSQTLLSNSENSEKETQVSGQSVANVNSQTENPQDANNLLAQKNQWQQQLGILQQDLKKYRTNGNIEQEIRTLNNIVIIYIEINDYPKAIEYSYLAQSKLNQSNLSAEKKSFIEPELLIALGTIYADQGNYPQVLKITRKIAEIQNIRIGSLTAGIGDVEQKPGKKPVQQDVRKDAQSLYLIATTQQKRGKIREALRTAEEALKILKAGGEKEGEREVSEFINTLHQQL